MQEIKQELPVLEVRLKKVLEQKGKNEKIKEIWGSIKQISSDIKGEVKEIRFKKKK